jgi:hypothetical protein
VHDPAEVHGRIEVAVSVAEPEVEVAIGDAHPRPRHHHVVVTEMDVDQPAVGGPPSVGVSDHHVSDPRDGSAEADPACFDCSDDHPGAGGVFETAVARAPRADRLSERVDDGRHDRRPPAGARGDGR